MKNKKMIILTLITGIIVTTIGITYSIFTSSKTGKNSSLVAGDVYMHYANGNKSINLANVMPSETYDATSFFEFTIDGKNTTTNKDIWYEIILKHGDEVSGKTRIKDNLLKFTLTETKNGTTTTVFDGRSYGDLTNKRIWVNTINKNTTSEVSITYRLYMWISNNTVIGNVDQDYTMDEWKNIFASIKVDVAGDFNEKSIATNESCFTVGTINDGNEVAILNYNETCGTDVIIPNTIKGYPVTVIGNSETSVIEQLSNKNNNYKLNDLNNYQKNVNIKPTSSPAPLGSFEEKNLTSVVIPNSVTIIDGFAFSGNQLTSVTISNSVTTIGASAFYNNQLMSITIPDGVTTIGSSAFQNNLLTSVVILNSVTIIDEFAFSYNLLTSVTIPNSVTTIENYAFSSNKLTSLIIPDGVITIGNNAFNENKLTNVKLPGSLTSIGEYAFQNNQLETFEIPNGLTMLTDFLGNNPLKSITFQENSKITTIGQGFISGTSFNIHEKYQILESIEIPNSITDIIVNNSIGPFFDLNLKEVIFEDNSKLTKIPAFSFRDLKLINVNIPNGVTEIGMGSFARNQLTSVVIPDSVTTIGSSAFSYNKLTSVTIPDSVTEIGMGSFASNQLKNLTIPSNVETIGNGAFSSNQLASVTIENGIQYIGNAAFSKSSSSNPNLSKISINKSCADIKNIQGSSSDITKYYPWLSSLSPYTASGVTIYGSNNEVCDSY